MKSLYIVCAIFSINHDNNSISVLGVRTRRSKGLFNCVRSHFLTSSKQTAQAKYEAQ